VSDSNPILGAKARQDVARRHGTRARVNAVGDFDDNRMWRMMCGIATAAQFIHLGRVFIARVGAD
jgi:hypothetical protein